MREKLIALVPKDLCKQLLRATEERDYEKCKDEVIVAPECGDPAVARQVASMFDLQPDSQEELAEYLVAAAGKRLDELPNKLTPEKEQELIEEEVSAVANQLVAGWIQSLHLMRGETPTTDPVRLDGELLPTVFPFCFDSLKSWYEILAHAQMQSLDQEAVTELYKAFAAEVAKKAEEEPTGYAVLENADTRIVIKKDLEGYFVAPVDTKTEAR